MNISYFQNWIQIQQNYSLTLLEYTDILGVPSSEHPIMHNTSWTINLSLRGRGDPLMGV